MTSVSWWSRCCARATLCALVTVTACSSEKASGTTKTAKSTRPTVTEQGAKVTFDSESPGLAQFGTAKATRGSAVLSVRAPAHVVATIASSSSANERIVLFESSDATSVWSQFRQGKVAVERTSKVLARVKTMYDNQGATGRDVTEAETDAATARANLAEFEARIRATGFDTRELERLDRSVAWMMADVPEAELHQVARGGVATVNFNAFPGAATKGSVMAIGDIVDPVSRTVKVRIEVSNGDRRVLPGMYGRVAFNDARRAVVVLPASAIVTVEEKDYAFVRSSPTEFVRRPVTLERAGADSVIVVNGVSEGEDVVITGAMLLKGLSFGY